MRTAFCSVSLALAALLQGCATQALQAPLADEPPPPVAAVPQAKGSGGGVFTGGSSWSLVADRRVFHPGDVLTVMLQETTQASKKADTSIGKDSDVAVKAPVLAGKALKADIGLGASRDFSGSASSTQQNTLQGAITVVVQEVLPNGLMRVSGQKVLTLNQGEEFIRLSGYVRPADVDVSNRVSSQRIANARIAYAGQGAMADANSAGWLTRLFFSPVMPF
ncbi:flagellar basal body L-ring protein FlgH [Aquabacterium sp. A7-Y]|uniref:flagellar basal body L-ring protein FlgH n=1 Tax=Aquabacterium sp. A7-Y TaxID=1349605 RepID=UPI00223E1D2E|nr:flagellar basal body L-ring protein FlgH [Aquabacterium sp. A7-Y]MCW7536541.1 flagellar basal body L-ring protein FlgH [Aquabacterium sp. A7-Y]